MRRAVLVLLLLAGGALLLVVGLGRRAPAEAVDGAPPHARPAPTARAARTTAPTPAVPPRATNSATDGAAAEVEDAPPPAETAPRAADEDEEERAVEAFDATVDAWMAPRPGGVTLAEVDRFRAAFARVPKGRRDECLHRALNLVPDENVMLLAGLLFDKTQDRETLDLVYSDILNRDEDVKRPILQEIFKDREHPCWADTAWILDVTGERPAAAPPRTDAPAP